MKMKYFKAATLFALPLFSALTASAHVGYTGRTFTLSGLTAASTTLPSSVASNYGWADGADEDFGNSHMVRPFRISLANSATVTFSIQSTAPLNTFLPAFTIYSGLAHLPPAPADHDGATSLVTVNYLATLLGPPREGAFDALNTFYMGNDDTPANPSTGTPAIPGTLSVFTYVGHVADGTSTNFGTYPGILGDGLADGYVSASFALPAGEYTVFVGGANYNGQFPTLDTTNYTFTATAAVTPVPEPLTFTGLLIGAAVLGSGRQKRR